MDEIKTIYKTNENKQALEEVLEQVGVYEYCTIDEIYENPVIAEELLMFIESVNKHKETIRTALHSQDDLNRG